MGEESNDVVEPVFMNLPCYFYFTGFYNLQCIKKEFLHIAFWQSKKRPLIKLKQNFSIQLKILGSFMVYIFMKTKKSESLTISI